MNNKKGGSFRTFMKFAILYLGRLLTVAFILFAIGYGLQYAQSSPYGRQRFAIRHLDIRGIQNADKAALEAMVRRGLPANLLQVSPGQVREIVESEPWIKSATVRRVFPDRLVITLEERQPAAVATIDGELYVVDADGTVLDHYSARHKSVDGPIVKGLINVARENAREDNRERMRAYLAVVTDFKKAAEDLLGYISEIDVDNPRKVALIPTDEPIPVFVGDRAFFRRYQTFRNNQALYEELKQQYGAIEYVDVTFEDKIIFHTPQSQQALMRAEAQF
ncbi:MAG: cell division protein FtsQ/DivIB [Acidobacteriota bacterium]